MKMLFKFCRVNHVSQKKYPCANGHIPEITDPDDGSSQGSGEYAQYGIGYGAPGVVDGQSGELLKLVSLVNRQRKRDGPTHADAMKAAEQPH